MGTLFLPREKGTKATATAGLPVVAVVLLLRFDYDREKNEANRMLIKQTPLHLLAQAPVTHFSTAISICSRVMGSS
jgi:hypothetical protein